LDWVLWLKKLCWRTCICFNKLHEKSLQYKCIPLSKECIVHNNQLITFCLRKNTDEERCSAYLVMFVYISVNITMWLFTGRPWIFLVIYILYRQMYTVSCYLTQFLLLNAAQHVSSLHKAHLQQLFRWNYNSYIIGI
jgi:hypothetical protein